MSGLNEHPWEPGAAGARWRALSGDLPQLPQLPHPPQLQPNQWQNPYAQHVPIEQPPYPDAEQAIAEPQPFVAVEQLEPVGPPRYLAPQRAARDPRQRAMAATITFVAVLIGLWGILGFMGSLTKTLTAINSGNGKLRAQMLTANAGLEKLDAKTQPLAEMSGNTAKLSTLLSGVDTDMGSMLTGVDKIAAGMTTMGGSLDTLNSELGKVNDATASMSTELGSINTGLGSQLSKVRTMRRDVQATDRVIGTLPDRLGAVNGRLAHVNGVVNIMGCRGITNNLKVNIKAGSISTGTATVYATVVPPAAWGVQADGKTPC